MNDTLKVVSLEGGKLRFLDQTRLPLETEYVETASYQEVISAIERLRIRGAPLIGIAAAYGVVLAALDFKLLGLDAFKAKMLTVCNEFAASRPTAVNLFWALDRMREIVKHGKNVDETVERLRGEAIELHEDDKQRCLAIGGYGEELVPEDAVILTHCNAGALATGGQGTALSVIFEAHRTGKLKMVYADETRPLLQGARLTMWELMQQDVPSMLITDSMAAATIASKGVNFIVTGADRIAANGDTANKIGTYGVAIAAKHHGVPFYIAAPLSTIDLKLASGSEIPIEQRRTDEVVNFGESRTAPHGAEAYNPAFDVTPADLISGIITEKGVAYPPFSESIGLLFT